MLPGDSLSSPPQARKVLFQHHAEFAADVVQFLS
jgi:hypothetical protein